MLYPSRKITILKTNTLSLIIGHLLGNDYKNDKLKTFKPHHISTTSFKTPSAFEVALIPYMLKVANISTVPEQTLILPSKEMNVGNIAYKSLSGTTVQPVDQPKTSTYKRSKKKKIISSSEPETSKNVRQSKSKKPVAETQYAEESVATVDATKSLEASKSAEEIKNQPKPVDAKKEHVTIVEEVVEDPMVIYYGIRSMGNVTFDQAVNTEAEESSLGKWTWIWK
ncbi:hypothetical protein Tco_0169641 [Tanacetum coccineum]